MKKYHKKPISCYITKLLFGTSPSIKFAGCSLGVKKQSDKCFNCEGNLRQIVIEGFEEGLQNGLKNTLKV